MRKKLLTMLILGLAVAFNFQLARSQTDSVLIDNFETNSLYNLWGWGGLTINVDNPLIAGNNTSSKVAKFHITTQYSNAIVVEGINPSISLATFPMFKIKVKSDSAVSKNLTIKVTDIKGLSQSLTIKLPVDVNKRWVDTVFDFSTIAKNTGISFVSSMLITCDYGSVISPSNKNNIYYFDDLRFCGPKVNVTSTTKLIPYNETFSTNAWFTMNTNTIQWYTKAEWGGSAFRSSTSFYNLTDSILMAGGGNAYIKLFTSAKRSGISYFTINNLPLEGKGNILFSFKMKWLTTPGNTDAPTVEYQLKDQVSWTKISTASGLPTTTSDWGTVEYPVNAKGTSVKIKISNNSGSEFYVDDIQYACNFVFADSVAIWGENKKTAIDVKVATLQMFDSIYPSTAAQTVIWSLENVTGKATISNTGLITPLKNGTVKVKARALDFWGSKTAEKTITLSNQWYPVTAIQISATDSIKKDNDTISVKATVEPSDADTTSYTLSVADSAGKATLNAYIENGKLIAVKNGYVIVTAKANDSKAATAKKTIIINGQDFIPCTSVKITGDTAIKTSGGSVQLSATVLPTNADVKKLSWSLSQIGNKAAIDANGLVKAFADGTVYAKATTIDGTALIDSFIIVITNQVGIDSVIITGKDSIKTDDGVLNLTATVYPLNASNKNVSWSIVSSNDSPDTALISNSGSVTAVRNGKITVKVFTEFDASKYDEFDITIVNQLVAVSKLSLTASQTKIEKAFGTVNLTSAIFPADASDKSVLYTISDASIASMSKTGVVKAIKNGVVTAYAKASNGLMDSVKITITNQPSWSEFTLDNKVYTPGISSEDDYSVFTKTCWDVDSIYMIIDVKDDTIVSTGGNPWDVDNIEIYFDMTNGKVANWPRTNGWPPAYNGLPGYYQVVVCPDQTFAERNPNFVGNVFYKYKKTNTGYNYEVHFGLKDLDPDFVAAAGKQIGFDMLASDNDTDPAVRNQISYSCPNTLIYCDPASWATVEMLEGGKFKLISDNEKPTAPALTATSVKSVVTLKWDASTDNRVVQQYVILQDFSPIDTLVALKEGNSASIKGLADGTYKFSVYAKDVFGNNSDTSSVDVTVKITGVSSLAESLITLYPNPATNYLNISHADQISSVEIFNLDGKLVSRLQNIEDNGRINISDFKDGMYSLRLIGIDNSVTMKTFIKK